MTESADPKQVLSGHDVEAELLDDWRILFSTLHARFDTGSFEVGARLVQGIAEAAESMNHHPDVDLSYPRVDVRISSHDVGGVTSRDVELARTISRLAGQLGAPARPEQLMVVELGLDSADYEEIKPFWAALMGYEGDENELLDTDGTMPTIWFQGTDAHEAPRQRWHLDLRVPPETVDARIKAALDAGGTLVSDARAPAFWVLADPQGNQACITTWLGRDPA